MHELPPILTDGEVLLRPMAEPDLVEVSRHFNDPRVARWLAAVVQPFGPEAARELMSHGTHAGENLWVIEQRGRVVGGLCAGRSLWYWLAPEFWRQGLMKQAVMLAIAARFAGPASPLIATCHEDNAASRALLAAAGFSASPTRRRMFFHATQTSEPCRDYVMTPEQWHFLHPPVLEAGNISLRPARQNDAPALALILTNDREGPWFSTGGLTGFIEENRYRGLARGLFVIADRNRCSIGAALLESGNLHMCFASCADKDLHQTSVKEALGSAFPGRHPAK